MIGSGVGKRLSEVRWGVAGRMALAWVFTLPAAAVVGAVSGRVAASGTAGLILVALAATAVAAGIYRASWRSPVTADNVNSIRPQAAGEPAATPI